MSEQRPAPHEWDDDGCCVYCGFDGAEHWWWAHDTYEGRSAPDENRRLPPCRDPRTGLVRMMRATPTAKNDQYCSKKRQ